MGSPWGSTWSENYDGEVINQLTHTPESPLYWRHNASRWYFSTLLETCWRYVSIDSFEDFLVDQDRQFQNTPNSRVDSFRFFDIYSPLGEGGGEAHSSVCSTFPPIPKMFLRSTECFHRITKGNVSPRIAIKISVRPFYHPKWFKCKSNC